MKKKYDIAIVAGGTGGHVFPAVAVADGLSESCEVLFVTDERGKKFIGKYSDDAIVQKINTKNRFFLYCSLLLNIMKLFFVYRNEIKNLEYVVGFGGYPSVPFLIVSKIFGKKIAIHEQNAVIGKANKFLSSISDDMFVSFQETCGIASSRSIVVGNPTRFEHLYDFVKYEPNILEPRVLVVGGSQGAGIFSSCVTDVICSIDRNVFVYHQVVSHDIFYVNEKYNANNVKCDVKAFFTDIDLIFQCVDLVISRAGSSSIFEIVGFKRPSILIPYKYSINGDQYANAKIMENAECSMVVSEDNIHELGIIVRSLLNDVKKLTKMSRCTRNLYLPATSNRLVDVIRKQLKV